MNRHHPYGENPMRRGAPPAGPGPDRSYRGGSGGGYRGGRGGRGRGGAGGGYGSYDSGNMNNGNYNTYDQPPEMAYGGGGGYPNMPPQAAHPPPQQDPYFQNYGAGPSAAHYPPPMPPSAGYAPPQEYNKFEGHSNSYGDDSGGYGRGGARRPPPIPQKRDDSIIEERIQRERPCRTLFIRNIKYETDSDDVRRQFEEFGDIRTFFDLISTRGMVFVTYFDLRAAERARERLQDTEISGRPIDVHYSLPRDDSADAKNIEMQGTLNVILRSSPSGQPIDDNEVRRKMQQLGDVKSVKPVGNRVDARYVEFFDTRAAIEAYERLRHQSLQDGVMDIEYAWDVNNDDRNGPRGDHDARGGGRGRGRGRGAGRGAVPAPHREDDWERRDREFKRPRDEGYSDRGGGRGRGGGYGGGYGGHNDRYDDRDRGWGGGGGPGGPPPGPSSYGGPPRSGPPPPAGFGGPSHYGGPPPMIHPPQPPPPTLPPTGADDRLEQARKVQQLLAALKQPPPTGTPPMQSAPPPQASPPGPPRPTAGYYGPGPGMPPQGLSPQGMPAYPGPPAPSIYPPIPHGQSSTPQPTPGALPPNIMALLQAAHNQQQQSPPPQGSPYGGQPPMNPNSPSQSGQANLAQLMSILQQAGGGAKQ